MPTGKTSTNGPLPARPSTGSRTGSRPSRMTSNNYTTEPDDYARVLESGVQQYRDLKATTSIDMGVLGSHSLLRSRQHAARYSLAADNLAQNNKSMSQDPAITSEEKSMRDNNPVKDADNHRPSTSQVRRRKPHKNAELEADVPQNSTLGSLFTRSANRAMRSKLTKSSALKGNLGGIETYQATAAHLRGMECLRKNEYDRAVSEFSQSIKLSPNDFQSYLNRAKAFMKLSRYEPAIADYTKMMSMTPPSAEMLDRRAHAYEQMGNSEKAIEDYSRLLELEPSHLYVLMKRGMLYAKEGQLDKALIDFGEMTLFDPRFEEGFRQRAQIYTRMGKYELAVRDYDSVIDLENLGHRGLQKRSLLERASALQKLAEYTQRTESVDSQYFQKIQNAEEGNPKARKDVTSTKNEVSILDLKCNADLLRIENVETCCTWPCWSTGCRCKTEPPFRYPAAFSHIRNAIDDYSMVLRLDVQCTEALYLRGRARQSIGQWKEALSDYSAALEANPSEHASRLERAAVYAHLDQPDLAIKELSTLLDALTSTTTTLPIPSALISATHFGRGSVYVCVGDFDAAIEDFTKVIEYEESKENHTASTSSTTTEIELERGDGEVISLQQYSSQQNVLNIMTPPSTPFTEERNSGLVRARLLRARSFMKTNATDESVQDYDALLNYHPENKMFTKERRQAIAAQDAAKQASVEEAYQWLLDNEAKANQELNSHKNSSKKSKKRKKKKENKRKSAAGDTDSNPSSPPIKSLSLASETKGLLFGDGKDSQENAPEELVLSSTSSTTSTTSPKSPNLTISSARDDACEALLDDEMATAAVAIDKADHPEDKNSSEILAVATEESSCTESSGNQSKFPFLGPHSNETQKRMQQRILERQIKDKCRWHPQDEEATAASSTSDNSPFIPHDSTQEDATTTPVTSVATPPTSSSVSSGLLENGMDRAKILIDEKYLKKRRKQLEKLRTELIKGTKSRNYELLVSTLGRVQRKHMNESLNAECTEAQAVVDEIEAEKDLLSSATNTAAVEKEDNSDSLSVDVHDRVVLTTFAGPERLSEHHSIASTDSKPSEAASVVSNTPETSEKEVLPPSTGETPALTADEDANTSVIMKLSNQNKAIKRSYKNVIEEKNAEIAMLRAQLRDAHLHSLASYGNSDRAETSDLEKLSKSYAKLCKNCVSRMSSAAGIPACDRVDQLIRWLGPTPEAERQRNMILQYVRRLVNKCLNAQVIPTGSYPLKTYLPDGDIDASILVDAKTSDEWYLKVVEAFCVAAKQKIGKPDAPQCFVRNVTFINAEIKVVQCTINNISVDLTANQVGALAAVQLFDEMDKRVGKSHLFKRSLLLIKAWCLYESRTYVDGTILGARVGALSTYALNTMVMSLFNSRWRDISHPLQALVLFLSVYSEFDWRHNALSLEGIVSIATMQLHPSKDGKEMLLDPKLLGSLRQLRFHEVNGGHESAIVSVKALHDHGAVSQHAGSGMPGCGFQVRHCNVIDPLLPSNNVARSVTAKSLMDIRKAFVGGRNRMVEILCSMKSHVPGFEARVEKVAEQSSPETLLNQIDCVALDEFFSNCWRTYGRGDGWRPDLLVHPRQPWPGLSHPPETVNSSVDVFKSSVPVFRYVDQKPNRSAR